MFLPTPWLQVVNVDAALPEFEEARATYYSSKFNRSRTSRLSLTNFRFPPTPTLCDCDTTTHKINSTPHSKYYTHIYHGMEDLEMPVGSPSLLDNEEPEALNDARDPLNRGIDEEDHEPMNPISQPTADTDAYDDDDDGVAAEGMDEPGDKGFDGAMLDDDDNESELEELDEKEFEDFDPSALNIPDKPVAVDSDNVGLLGVHKRKRTEEEERERKKKKKEGRREKTKKPKRVRAGGDDEEDFEGGPELEGKRQRRPKAVGDDGKAVRRAPRPRTPENEENLSPEERRRRALDRKMDEALKSYRPTARRRGVHNLEEMADAEIEAMRQKMAKACEADAEARSRGEVATHKLKILPEVVELMNRNTIQSQLVDPDTNILEAVRFMLEPADHDAALPNYQIQRELFAIMRKLTIGKDALIASGIGKVVLFYTKSIQPQPEIKRQAERLIGEWMRVVLGNKDKKRKHDIQSKTYDPLQAAQQARNKGVDLTPAEKLAQAQEKRRKVLAQPIPGNRARADGSGLPTYTVAPVNNLSNATVGGGGRGGGGDAAFRRLVAKHGGGKAKRYEQMWKKPKANVKGKAKSKPELRKFMEWERKRKREARKHDPHKLVAGSATDRPYKKA